MIETLFEISKSNLLSPAILCFFLGIFAGSVRSDLKIPEPMAKALSIYLMLAIGIKGGACIHQGSADGIKFLFSLLLALGMSFLMPFLGYSLLRASTSLNRESAAAIAAHYGSISIVTFFAAVDLLKYLGFYFEEYLTAMAAFMETPAIISGLFLVKRFKKETSFFTSELLREIFFNGSIVLLLGGFFIGSFTSERNFAALSSFFIDPFKGVLCLFLLDMGILVSRRFVGFKNLGGKLFLFGLYMPLIGAFLGTALAYAIGLSLGGMMLFAVLCASASYIAVPAAMRLAVPEVNPSLYVSLSLGVTFPFNITIGIPLYFWLIQWFFS